MSRCYKMAFVLAKPSGARKSASVTVKTTQTSSVAAAEIALPAQRSTGGGRAAAFFMRKPLADGGGLFSFRNIICHPGIRTADIRDRGKRWRSLQQNDRRFRRPRIRR